MDTHLAEILDAQGRRRDWLAAQTGVSPSLVTMISRGQRSPSADFRRRAAEALGVPEDELFPEVDAPVAT